MRVALNFIAVGARRGGAEAYVGMLARTLIAAGHEVHVVAECVDSGELPATVTFHPISLPKWLGLSWLRPYRFAAESARILASETYDLVIGFSHVWRQDVCLATNGCRRALLADCQQRSRSRTGRALWQLGKLLSPKQSLFRWIEYKQFQPGNVPFVIAPSERVARDFEHFHGVPRNRIAVVPLGIELANKTINIETRAASRQRLGLSAGDVAILFAARNYALKGLEPLLHAFARLATGPSTPQLLVCGSDRERRFRRLAARLGVADRVHFLGSVEDTRSCFAAANLFAMPTFYDACSLVVIEALAAGLPVITTQSNGASEVITPGSDGFIIDTPWSLDQLAGCLQMLVADADLRKQMGKQALRSSARLSIEASVRNTLCAIEDWRAARENPPGRIAA